MYFFNSSIPTKSALIGTLTLRIIETEFYFGSFKLRQHLDENSLIVLTLLWMMSQLTFWCSRFVMSFCLPLKNFVLNAENRTCPTFRKCFWKQYLRKICQDIFFYFWKSWISLRRFSTETVIAWISCEKKVTIFGWKKKNSTNFLPCKVKTDLETNKQMFNYNWQLESDSCLLSKICEKIIV